MIRSIKTAASLVLFASAVSAFAVETGFILGDSTAGKVDKSNNNKLNLEQSEFLKGNIRVPLTEDGLSFISAEGTVKHKLVRNFGADTTDNSIILDVDLFKLSTVKKFDYSHSLEFSAGRFYIADASGAVFTQTCDGAFAKYASPKLEVSVYGGYTGLLNQKNISIKDTNATVYSGAGKDIYDFNSAYIVGSATVSAPFLFANQSVILEGLAVIGSEGPADVEKDKNRFYGTFCLNGPLSNSVFYSATATVESVDSNGIGLLGQLSVNSFFDWKNAALSFNAMYASGVSGSNEMFVGVTQQTICNSSEEPDLAGIVKFGISASALPVNNILCSCGADVVMKDNGTKVEYYGLQFVGGVNYQLYSDVSFGLNGSAFVGNDENTNRFQISLNAAIAL